MKGECTGFFGKVLHTCFGFNGNPLGSFGFNFCADPVSCFGPPGSYYATGAVQLIAYSDEYGVDQVKSFDNPVEVCFVDPGVGTVKFWTGSGWQVFPTYVVDGYRCTQTNVPGWFTIIAHDWES